MLADLAAWWQRGLDTQFDVAHEGCFGADTYAGGIDTLGHAFSFGLGIETPDALALALGWLVEMRPGFGRWFAFRSLHSSAGDPQRRHDHHQCHTVLRLSGWSGLAAWNSLRYVEIPAGFGAVGFSGESSLEASDDRARTAYAGIGLNLTELLDRTAFSGEWRGGRTHRFATELLRCVQVPGTAAIGEAHVWRR